jgi:excisionase family DNA binding protein
MRLLTTAEVAERLRLHRKTVERAIRRGELRAWRPSAAGPWRIRPEWVDHWIDARGTHGGAARHRIEEMPTLARPSREGRLEVTPGMGRDTA